jgi:hypothetical protein
MPILDEMQFLERVQFFNGQRLFAGDLQTLESFNREMRWLHNQSLHQPGVGSGYAVIGNVGDRDVTVSPGYALDSLGREIILTETLKQAIPPVADNGSGGSVFYLLAVSYPDDTDLTPSETRAGICAQQGVVRLREEPVFCWVRLNDNDLNRQPVDPKLKQRISKGLFIVLAQIEVFNCKLKQPVSAAQRRNAVPAKQPRIACGIQSNTQWTQVSADGKFLPDLNNIGTLQLTADVSTSIAGFSATPFYTARIMGQRIFTDSSGKPAAFADALVSLMTNPTPTPQRFRIQIFPFFSFAGSGILDGVLVDQISKAWQVAWMGIES